MNKDPEAKAVKALRAYEKELKTKDELVYALGVALRNLLGKFTGSIEIHLTQGTMAKIIKHENIK